MEKKHYHWAIPLMGAVLFGAAISASAEQDKITYLTSTNRVTLSLRYGLNIHAKFTGIGGTPIPGSPSYIDGYVVTASPPNTSPNPNYTTYWGYDSTEQLVGSPGAYTGVAFINPGASGISSDVSSSGDKPYPGFELAYDRELLEKENWHNLRFGLEGALNYMNISVDNSSAFGGANAIDVYQFPIAIPQPPFTDTGLPGQSALQVPGSHPSSATFYTQDRFDANLFGFRLGPYVEFPFGDKEQFTLLLSGGLAGGLLDTSESWKQTFTFGNNTITSNGGGSDFDALWGFYVEANANYQFNEHWGIAASLQFQDLGKYDHSFQGRQVELDLSRSLFVELGISYSF